MEYTELVKSLRQCAEAYCAGCKNELVQIGCRGLLQHEAADAIEHLLKLYKSAESDHDDMRNAFISEVEKHRWIPVEERLPEKYEPVLVCYRSYNTGEPMADCNAYVDGDGDWCWYDGFQASGEMVCVPVTHWQPLPEPPKEETE